MMPHLQRSRRKEEKGEEGGAFDGAACPIVLEGEHIMQQQQQQQGHLDQQPWTH